KWEERLRSFRPGESAELLVARRERLLPLQVTFAAPPEIWRLEPDPAATTEHKARLEAWLREGGTLRFGRGAGAGCCPPPSPMTSPSRTPPASGGARAAAVAAPRRRETHRRRRGSARRCRKTPRTDFAGSLASW